jgi:hypothetical protein
VKLIAKHTNFSKSSRKLIALEEEMLGYQRAPETFPREYQIRASALASRQDARHDLVQLDQECIRLSRPASRIFDGQDENTGFGYIDEILTAPKISAKMRVLLLDIIAYQARNQLPAAKHKEVKAYLVGHGWENYGPEQSKSIGSRSDRLSNFPRVAIRLPHDLLATAHDLPITQQKAIAAWYAQEVGRLAKVIGYEPPDDPALNELVGLLAHDPPDIKKVENWLNFKRKSITADTLLQLFSAAMGRGYVLGQREAADRKHASHKALDRKLVELWHYYQAKGYSKGKAAPIIVKQLKDFATKEGFARGLTLSTVEKKLKAGALQKLIEDTQHRP